MPPRTCTAAFNANPKKLFGVGCLDLLLDPSGTRAWRKLARKRRDGARRLLVASVNPAETREQTAQRLQIWSRLQSIYSIAAHDPA